MEISPIQDIIADIKAGKMVVLMDAEDRENEGDLVLAAEFASPDAINFMIKQARGLVCLTLTGERCDQLNLPLMVSHNGTPLLTNFTVSIEAAHGVTTGISAADRSRTIQAAVARHAKPQDLVQPGHIFPLRARNGGVLTRAGHTEAGCDLAMLANLEPASVICEIMNDDGSMARLPQLLEFAQKHQLKVGTIADLIEYRHRTESIIEHLGQRSANTPFGLFNLHVFRDKPNQRTHLALVKGQIQANIDTLVRVHYPLSVLDIMAPENSKFSWTLPQAMQHIQDTGCGVLLLLHTDETSEVLAKRALEESVQRQRWDSKTFGIGAQMLRHLGIGKMKLMSEPVNLPPLSGFGLEITEYCQANQYSPEKSI